ncbi:MAG: hypothetical protein AAFR36_27485, partial [Bacteroidota bacterium]
MANIDDYLAEDASAEERQAAEQVLMGLDSLQLQQKVKRAAAERIRLQNIARRRMAGMIILLALLIGAAVYWRSLRSKTPAEEEPQRTESLTNEPGVPPSTPLETESTPLEENEPATTPPEEEPGRSESQEPPPPPIPENVPIAQTDPQELTPLPDPLHDAPNTFLRGQNNTTDSVTQARLNALWYTSYPLSGLELGDNLSNIGEALQNRNFTQAFIRVQRAERRQTPSDTLAYLKAYTFLEMGQGDEAARALSELEDIPEDWQDQSDWYQALALLLAGDLDAAQVLVTKITQEGGHSYQREAQKALEV